MNIKWIGSPNYSGKEYRLPIKYVVIHWIVGNLASADAVFQNDERDTSAHYGIEDGTIHQYVKEEDVAWHAGNWAINQASIGIEHSASPERNASEQTYITSAQLVREICERYNIPIDSEHIVPHNKYKATQCPGSIDLTKIINLARGEASTPSNESEWASQNDRLLQDMHARSICDSDAREDWVADDRFRNRVVDHIDNEEQTKKDQATEIDSLHAVNKQQAEMLDDLQNENQSYKEEIEDLETTLENQRTTIHQLELELDACENTQCPELPFEPENPPEEPTEPQKGPLERLWIWINKILK